MTDNVHTPGPTAPGERISALDMIRGFALLGILLMNIEYFQKPMQAIMLGVDTSLSGVDYAVAWFVYTFVQGKFYTMFSLLFGLGFVIFLDRALQRGAAARLLFARRLAVLLVIGALHVALVWPGDILLIYSVTGFLLLAFVGTPARRLWKWGIAIYVAPILLMWVAALMVTAHLATPEGADLAAQFAGDRERLLAAIASADGIYRDGTFAEVTRLRIHEYLVIYASGGIVFFVPSILGMFLIGAAFGRAGVFRDADAHRKLFARMAGFGFAIGIPVALYAGYIAPDLDFSIPNTSTATAYTAQAVASIALCLAYVGTLMLLSRRPGTGRILMRMAPAGRMALTNYLTQSIVFTLLFYGYGVGLYGEFGRAAVTVMAVVLYGLQLWFSGWWLDRYRSGPMEWLWRTVTYGRAQPLRAAHNAA